MIIDCISDLHGSYPVLEGGDLLICAGDCTSRDNVEQWMEFFEWFKARDYKHKVLVGGNHDGFLERCISSQEAREMMIDEQEGFEYLCDTGIEVEGLKIWGSPWTAKFCDWHFMLNRGEAMRNKWAMIPDDVDILVTHGPAYGVLDKALRFDDMGYEHCGCRDLHRRICQLKNLKLHVFGHIHEDYGFSNPFGLKSVNCAIMDRDYKPVNKPIRVIL